MIVGHRDDLLAGAKRCLHERGYGRTTARDIVAASGANLASIGYHFGSKEALLTAAIIESFAEWGDELDAVMLSLSWDADADPIEQFEKAWTHLIQSFATHRPLWVSSVEAFAQAEHIPELREQLATSFEETRAGMAAVIMKATSGIDEGAARTIGSLVLALLPGLALQWLLDPGRAPSGEDLGEAIRAVLRSLPTATSQTPDAAAEPQPDPPAQGS
ncbi:TetR/AcrR family transcriptional regulator [Streptosporangium oxazolinicum]|uniref:TetR/AcrR family transcriptional regulator n=1 Tax=Streptosporangium oxazolinicum TaxID=909287 RepID=A0ABP8AHS1_9ACTN